MSVKRPRNNDTINNERNNKEPTLEKTSYVENYIFDKSQLLSGDTNKTNDKMIFMISCGIDSNENNDNELTNTNNDPSVINNDVSLLNNEWDNFLKNLQNPSFNDGTNNRNVNPFTNSIIVYDPLKDILKDIADIIDNNENNENKDESDDSDDSDYEEPKNKKKVKKVKNDKNNKIKIKVNEENDKEKEYYNNFEPEIINYEEIDNIDKLIFMGKNYHPIKQPTYRGLDLKKIKNMVECLEELKNMVGLDGLKNDIVNQILFSLQGFNTDKNNNNIEMMHTVITGPPGVGKTTVARIIGKIYTALGLLSKGTFREVGRGDLIAKYLGQTAIKTQKVIDSCEGGVMFIDEAYALGHSEGRDSFSKECLDTLNKNLSNKRDFLCIIAGYKKDLDKCFFTMNEGLKRRFSFRYDIEKYNHKQLLSIFKGKVEKEGWVLNIENENIEKLIEKPDKKSIVDNYNKSLMKTILDSDDSDEDSILKLSAEEIYQNSFEYKNYQSKIEKCKSESFKNNDLEKLFRVNRELFPYSGGDVETLFLKCKIVHSKKLPLVRKLLSLNEIEEGFKKFFKDRKATDIKKKKSNEKIIYPMYVHK